MRPLLACRDRGEGILSARARFFFISAALKVISATANRCNPAGDGETRSKCTGGLEF